MEITLTCQGFCSQSTFVQKNPIQISTTPRAQIKNKSAGARTLPVVTQHLDAGRSFGEPFLFSLVSITYAILLHLIWFLVPACGGVDSY
jgi:hypothetical protein